MRKCVQFVTPLALAFVVSLTGSAFAGDNENVIVSLDTPAELSGLGPGETVTVTLSAAGMVGVKQIDITLEVSPADAFVLDVDNASFVPDASWPQPFIAPGVEFPAAGQVKSGGAILGTLQRDGDGVLGSFNLTTSATFTSDTEASISVVQVSLGPSSSERDVFDQGQLGLNVDVNPPPPPVSEPTLAADSGTATDVSLDFSAAGSGSAADGSAGEVTFTVNFADNTGSAVENQDITWTINNLGAESVFLVAPASLEIAAGTTETVTASTGADGSASGTFDSEGEATTTVSVTASTTAPNSDGVDRDLSVDFNATWDVPVAAELASFTAEITPQEVVSLQWAVASQTNNLGWEVYRSIDNVDFVKISGLIEGEGTSDQFIHYDFVDQNRPLGDVAFYYLKQIDLDGTTSQSKVLEVALPKILPQFSALSQNYPNPFNPETTIRFDLSNEETVTLTIYDITGQVVRTLIAGRQMAPGSYQEVWDGLNSDGVKVGSGLYLYQIKAGEFSAMKKMTLLQ